MREIFYRYGHANNSSSSHSVVYAPNDRTPEVYSDNQGFGWDDFLLKSREAKRAYLFAQVAGFFTKYVNDNINMWKIHSFFNHDIDVHKIESALYRDVYLFASNEFFDGEFNHLIPTDEFMSNDVLSLDHQSQWVFPRGKNLTTPDYDFIRNVISEITREEGLVIVGGNDNSTGDFLDIPSEPGHTDFIKLLKRLTNIRFEDSQIRQVRGTSAFILSDNYAGDIGIYSFDDVSVEKLDFPYLVDLKITDYCPYGCSFCYQGSTADVGRLEASNSWDHASKIRTILQELSSGGALEIVLGGGEPTTIKRQTLQGVIGNTRSLGMKCGMTTKNLSIDYWTDFIARASHKAVPNSVAFSINTTKEAKIFARLALSIAEKLMEKTSMLQSVSRSYDSTYRMGVYAQVVVGAAPRDEFFKTVELLKLYASRGSFDIAGITFLGYKSTGRGADFAHHEYEKEFIDYLKGWDRSIHYTVGVDSVLADKYGDDLANIVPKNRLLTKEGKYTCYVDAVENFIAPSSFAPADQRVPILRERYSLLSEMRNAFETF